jgi:predicted metal-dependent hydrolase
MALATQAIVGGYAVGPRLLGKSLYLLPVLPRRVAGVPIFGLGFFVGWIASMPLRALLYRRPSEPSVVQVVFDRAIYLVRLRRHRQARRYTLRIDAASRQVVLTMPPRGSVKEAKEFAQKHGGWIAARLRRLPEAAPFRHGVEVPLRGDSHRIVHRRGERGTVWTETDASGQALLCVAGEAPHVDRRISDFLKREAQRDLDAASRRYAAKLGVPIKRICVRDQSSRWGSCSNTGVLSFSWRLILAPSFVLDYLAAHEVSHLVELNHSLRFWRLVKRLYPDVERAKVWLDVHGTDLHRYGLAARRRAGDL